MHTVIVATRREGPEARLHRETGVMTIVLTDGASGAQP
jgi:hypothetical protein